MNAYETDPHQVITDAQFHQLLEDGYLILPRYIRGDELAELQAGQRRVLRAWEQVKDNPPADGAEMVPFPYPDVRMSRRTKGRTKGGHFEDKRGRTKGEDKRGSL